MKIGTRSVAAAALVFAAFVTGTSAAADGMRFAKERLLLDGSTPSVCLDFSAPVAFPQGTFPEDYVAVAPAAEADVRVQDGALCVGGLRWGTSYSLTLRAGVPAADRTRTEHDTSVALKVPDAPASVGFSGSGYVLAQAGETALPLATVNVDKVRLRVLRIVDRNLITELAESDFARTLNGWSAEQIAQIDGEVVWEGAVETPGPRNERVRTGVPIDQVVDRSIPGVHVVTAEPWAQSPEYWENRATQWLVISNLGLTTFTGEDGMTAFVNALDTATPVEGVETVLLARNNKVLARATTDAAGRVDFAGGLLRGNGGNEATALLAYGANRDFTVLRLTGPAFDLSDRGVSGRTPPGPLDGFLWADRDIYRPGETLHLAALLRTAEARAVEGVPVTLAIVRPDGQDFRRIVLPARDGGAYTTSLALPKSAPTGGWNALMYADPKGVPIAEMPFSVEDFVPERLDLELTADTSTIAPDGSVPIALTGRFLFGAPAADLRVTSEVIVSVDPEPFPDWADYRFGLATEEWSAIREELEETWTDAEGKGSVTVALPEIGDTTLPLLARVRSTIMEPGGRGVRRALDLKIRRQPLAVGIRPGFADEVVPEDGKASFQLVALDTDGQAVAGQKLGWELIREVWHYDWVRVNGNWEVETSVHDRRVDTGTVQTTAAGPQELSLPVEWGWYRLEVYDAATGVASSVRFQAGWRAGPVAGSAPDKVKVALDKDRYRPGETVRVFVEPPYAGEALVTVLGRGILETKRLTVPAAGAEFTLTADDAWGASGAYVAVMLLRPGRPAGAATDAPPSPGRAIGLSWLTLDRSGRHLAVTILAPSETLPEQRLAVPVAVSGLDVGEKAWLTLAAVDRGVLALTDFRTPDPEAHFFSKRALPIDLRDLYGRLIDGAYDRIGTVRAGGDDMGRNNAGLKDSYETVALFSGLVAVGPGGRVEIPLDIPDFNGELRLMAVAFSDDKVGHAEAPLPVRPPVVADLSRPRFLAPGDVADLTLELHNLTGGAGDYRIAVKAEGAAAIRDGGEQVVTLATGGKAERPVRLEATGTGVAELSLTLRGPGDLSIERRFAFSVRPAQTVQTERRLVWLAPGSMLRLDPAVAASFRTETVRAGVTLGTAPTFDLPLLIGQLYRYPYGCLEQTVSTAMPLLYLDDLAAYAKLDEDTAALRERVQKAIWRIMDMQRSDGAFSLWDAYGEAEPWLSSYALDFLTRARSLGYSVPDGAYNFGLDWLKAAVVEDPEWNASSVARPYALYVLTKAGRTDIAGAARYLNDNRLGNLPHGARGHLAASLRLLGETERARSLLADDDVPARDWSIYDYGTRLRDAALRLTVMTEVGGDDKAVGALAEQVADLAGRRRWLSTQEMSWLVLAAKAMISRQQAVTAEVDGRVLGPQKRPISAFPNVADLERGYAIVNRGGETLRVTVSTSGVPTASLPRESEGFTINRAVHALDGTPLADDAPLVQGERYVVVISGTSDFSEPHQGLLVDLLPAGVEIENTRLRSGGDLQDFAFLPALTEARYVEMRDDRFVAAYELSSDAASFTAAYIVRAVTRGSFTRPAAYVEDMYQPHRFARGALGHMTVAGASAVPR